MMRSANKTSRVLGVAFLLQFITSISSGVFFNPNLIVSVSITENLINLANNALLMRINILVDMFTALGIIFLGAILFLTLRKQNEKIALIALGFYILEAALLALSRTQAFSLLRISQEYVATGNPTNLAIMGSLALEAMDFVGSTLHMLVFCLGGILFYYLLDKSRIVPRVLSLWGLVTVFPMLIGTLMIIFGYEAPIYLYVLYMPFEFVIGVWILIKGIPE
jgi:hypothetical protein